MRDATPFDVLEGRARWCVVKGDALALLTQLPDASIDALLTDPPYSSGGAFRGDRMRTTDEKYTNHSYRGRRPDFSGDTRDQRAWGYWVALWGGEYLRVAKPQTIFAAFTDWRQLPQMADAIQAAGWIWRGIVSWDKGDGCRPTPGGFRNQCEYLVWGTNGPLPPSEVGVLILPGSYRVVVKASDKHHQTGKPTDLMRQLVRVAPPGGVILDLFGGSGTTAVAAIAEGRRVILCETNPEYCDVALARCEAADDGRKDWRPTLQQTLAVEVANA